MNPADLAKDGSGGKSSSVSPTFVLSSIGGIISLIALIHFGFFHSYIRYFPKFETGVGPFGPVEFNWIMHLHGMVMMGWVLMLLVQPILIRTGRRELHRKVGRLSYVLAPLVVLFLYFANKDAYQKAFAAEGEAIAVGIISLTFPALLFFSILYGLAMYYRKEPRLHMRFMISTAFLFIPPALDRALIYYFQLPGYDLGSNIELVIIGSVVLLDSVKTKRVSPFLLVFCFELLHKILWHSRETEAWQMIGRGIAKIF
jgi:uncharacterized membrane protein YozB (DUF420 family)